MTETAIAALEPVHYGALAHVAADSECVSMVTKKVVDALVAAGYMSHGGDWTTATITDAGLAAVPTPSGDTSGARTTVVVYFDHTAHFVTAAQARDLIDRTEVLIEDLHYVEPTDTEGRAAVQEAEHNLTALRGALASLSR